MKLFLLKFFTWWNGQTFGTQLWTWRFGELVGQDEQGNRYYRTKGRKIDPTLGFERRWVIYNGYAEASRVPPSWHGWLHHTVDTAPTEESYTAREWEKPHVPNMTGTPAAAVQPIFWGTSWAHDTQDKRGWLNLCAHAHQQRRRETAQVGAVAGDERVRVVAVLLPLVGGAEVAVHVVAGLEVRVGG